MNNKPAQFGQTILTFVLGILTVYGIWAVAGLFMVVLLSATAPLTAMYESVTFDYTVWTIILLVMLLPVIKMLVSLYPFTHKQVHQTYKWLWVYLVPAYLALVATMFLVGSLLGQQIIVVLLTIVSVIYFNRLHTLITK